MDFKILHTARSKLPLKVHFTTFLKSVSNKHMTMDLVQKQQDNSFIGHGRSRIKSVFFLRYS